MPLRLELIQSLSNGIEIIRWRRCGRGSLDVVTLLLELIQCHTSRVEVLPLRRVCHGATLLLSGTYYFIIRAHQERSVVDDHGTVLLRSAYLRPRRPHTAIYPASANRPISLYLFSVCHCRRGVLCQSRVVVHRGFQNIGLFFV